MSEIHQYKLRNGSSPAWYDEGTGPTPDAWHLDCVQPDHIWRTVYQQGHEAALSQPAGVSEAGVQEGLVLVPARMELTPENMETLAFMLGGDPDAKDADERWNGGTLWVGETVGDNGEKYYGLNVANVECYEEGSIPIVEFAAAPAASGVDTSTNEAWAARAQEKIEAMDAASVSERARECRACKGAGEVMQPVWTPDPQDGYDALGTCPRCGGNGSTFPQALQDLLYFTEHCLSAADEGVDYSTSREWLDAMTTMGVMKKTGRGKWAPSDQAQPVADALRAIEQALTQQRGAASYDAGMAMHWIERYAAGIDEECQLDRIAEAFTTPQPSADAVREVLDGMEELRDLAPRALELAERLVMSGPKAAHVSASETHEIADFVRDTVAMLSAASGEKGVG